MTAILREFVTLFLLLCTSIGICTARLPSNMDYYSNVSTKGLRVGHFSNHLGALRDQDYIFERLGMDVSDFFLLHYDVTEKFASEYFRKHVEVINAFDVVVTSDTTPLSRIFLQNLNQLKPRLVIWVCNRLDYDVHDRAYISLIKEALKRKDSKVIYVPYTQYEKEDALARIGVSLANNPTITPHGLQLSNGTMAEEVDRHYGLKGTGSSKVKNYMTRLKADGKKAIFVTRYENDQRHVNVPKIFEEHHIPHVSGSYSHPAQLREYSALVTFPDAMSKFLTFETIQYGVPTVLPSMSWLEKLTQTKKYFFNGDNLGHQPKRELWYLNEWYRFPECRIYVNNVDELVKVAKQLNDGTYPHLAHLKTKMQERAKVLARTTLKKWEIIYSASAMLNQSAVFRKVYDVDVYSMHSCLETSKQFLIAGTPSGDYSYEGRSGSHGVLQETQTKDKNRFESFSTAFQLMIRSAAQPKVIVQMGFSPSTAGAGEQPKVGWGKKDWGGASFTRLAAECNQHVDGMQFLVVDASKESLLEARAALLNYSFVSTRLLSSSSASFLKTYSGAPISLFYVDVETTSTFRFQLEEATIVAEMRNTLFATEAYILLDDVSLSMNQYQFQVQQESVQKGGESKNPFGKYRDSIPYLLSHGWEVVYAGYQWVIKAPALPVA